MARYEAGETLASIARTYDCSPPAISYVVSRSRMRHDAAPAPRPVIAIEPQLVKAAAPEPPPAALVAHPAAPQPQAADALAARPLVGLVHAADRHNEPPRHDGNGFAREGSAAGGLPPAPITAPDANGDPRPTLHLSLGGPANGPANGSGNGGNGDGGHHLGEPRRDEFHRPPHNGNGASPVPPHASPEPRASDMPHLPPRPAGNGQPPRNGEAGPVAQRDARGSSIDTELRARVDSDIAAFLAAFDAALSQDNQETRAGLREATDRLLRAGARTRIELERLEARTPLPRRDQIDRGEPAWRGR